MTSWILFPVQKQVVKLSSTTSLLCPWPLWQRVIMAGKGYSTDATFYYCSSSWSVGYIFRPSLHLFLWISFLCNFSSLVATALTSVLFLNPFCTHLNRSPELHWVIEYLLSFCEIGQLECVMMAEGMKTVEPGGNLITSLRFQRTSCPPLSGLNLPRAVIEHQP